ncbi:MAG: hypothetical protein AABY22_27060 [Nanoarchaeota archaeon]
MSEQKQKGQIMRYSDEELKLLNSTFSERTDLLLLLRKFLLQGDLDETERETIKLFKTSNILPIIQKTYLPVIDLNAPLSQLVDFWLFVETKDRNLEQVEIELKARKKLIDYTKERFKCLINGEEDIRDIRLNNLVYDESKEIKQAYLDLTARNLIVKNIEDNTIQLWVLSGQKKESAQDIQKRLFKNSSK